MNAVSKKTTIGGAKIVYSRKKRTTVENRYGGYTTTQVEKYAPLLIRAIDSDLSLSTFFTREDLLHLAIFSHVSTITRYNLVCAVVNYLIEQKELARLSVTDLARPDRVSAYSETPLQDQYAATIRRIVKKAAGKTVSVMDIVRLWTSDGHLTENNKRVAVRKSIKRLIHEEILTPQDVLSYTVRQ